MRRRSRALRSEDDPASGGRRRRRRIACRENQCRQNGVFCSSEQLLHALLQLTRRGTLFPETPGSTAPFSRNPASPLTLIQREATGARREALQHGPCAI